MKDYDDWSACMASVVSFLEQIFAGLELAAARPVLVELGDSGAQSITGGELQSRIVQARVFLSTKNLKPGDRVALLAPNSIDWVAVDLAIMAERLIVVPLYSRQAPSELVAMMKDCSPSLIICGDAALRDGIVQHWPDAPPQVLFDEVLAGKLASSRAGVHAPGELTDPVAIIYTSGTSGEAKGVVLNAGNVTHMLGCTSDRLDLLTSRQPGQDKVFHYLPFC